ncbi:MAG: hypothetical protein MUE69_28880, partial [Myxococcota bacterium]|nr:hypothetical protein [Myxococcota bacterium]
MASSRKKRGAAAKRAGARVDDAATGVGSDGAPDGAPDGGAPDGEGSVEASSTSSTATSPHAGSATSALTPRRRWLHVGLAALGGGMQCLGFAGFSWWPFAFVCFLPMFYVLDQERDASTKRVLALGLVHGFVGYTGGYYWLVEMLSVFSGFPKPLCWLMASLFFFYQGLQQMLIYGLYRRARDRGVGVT